MQNLLNQSETITRESILPRGDIRLFSRLELPSLDPAKATSAIACAEECLDREIPFLTLSMHRRAARGEDADAFANACNERRRMLSALTVGQLYEDTDSFINKICDLLWAISEESSWLSPQNVTRSVTHTGTDIPEVYSSERLHGLDLCATATAAGIALALYLFKDRLDEVSPLIRERMEYMLKDRCIKPFIFCDFSRFVKEDGAAASYAVKMLCNILTVCAVTEDDTSVRCATVNKCISELGKLNIGRENETSSAMTYLYSLVYDISGGKIKLAYEPTPVLQGKLDMLPYSEIYEFSSKNN